MTSCLKKKQDIKEQKPRINSYAKILKLYRRKSIQWWKEIMVDDKHKIKIYNTSNLLHFMQYTHSLLDEQSQQNTSG